MKLLGIIAVNAGAGTIAWSTGFATVAHTGAGDHLLTINPQADATETACFVQCNAAVAASAAPSFGINRPADNQIRVTCVQEQAAGAASIAADVDFVLEVWTRFGSDVSV